MTEYSFGIEEEYFVVGRRTGNIKAELSQAFMKAASKELGSHLTKELLQSQIEVVTRPLVDAEQARRDLLLFRRTLAELGQNYGIGILAAGTHPLARPDEHLTTNNRRYTKVIKELGIVGRKRGKTGGAGMILRFTGGRESDSLWGWPRPQTSMI